MNILIAGCARSGTTLTLSLMNCFADTLVYPWESGTWRFHWLGHRARNIVLKRRRRLYLSLPRLSGRIGLIYCIRHPFDVLTSSHPGTIHLRRFHVTPERWLGEYDALCSLRRQQPHRAIHFVRYEALVRTPDLVQRDLAAALSLTPRGTFSAAAGTDIFTTSVEKWRQNATLLDDIRHIRRPIEEALVRFCEEFDYDMPPT